MSWLLSILAGSLGRLPVRGCNGLRAPSSPLQEGSCPTWLQYAVGLRVDNTVTLLLLSPSCPARFKISPVIDNSPLTGFVWTPVPAVAEAGHSLRPEGITSSFSVSDSTYGPRFGKSIILTGLSPAAEHHVQCVWRGAAGGLWPLQGEWRRRCGPPCSFCGLWPVRG